MNFLEARRILSEFKGGPELPFLFGLSGTADPFRLFLEAAAAAAGYAAKPRFIPFNTLQQHFAGPVEDEAAIYFLTPWDFVAEADWRSGVPVTRLDFERTIERAQQVANSIARRTKARAVYLPAPIPPVAGVTAQQRQLEHSIEAIAASVGARSLPREAFSLGSYFSSGCPVGGTWLGPVATTTIDELLRSSRGGAKVLVTDLDNTLWSGVIAEDGPEGIRHGPEGAGYRHHVYQTLLARLKGEGVIIAAVSRNDAEVVLPPLRSGGMPLREEDFVAVSASYHAKSAQIAQLATNLNLGLDSFVFVDDNPVEQEEVRAALPQVRVIPFPTRDDALPGVLHQLVSLFERGHLTVEDRERTALYRRRLEGMAPVDAKGADLTQFLRDLGMRLTVHDRTQANQARAIQLINKTNQFNANGKRWTEEEITDVLQRDGRLFGASLADRSGSHGEVIACLIGSDGVIEALVMSCRVFQRRAEHAFFGALADRGIRPKAVRYAETDRNEPFRQFIASPAFGPRGSDLLQFDAEKFATEHAGVSELFDVTWE